MRTNRHLLFNKENNRIIYIAKNLSRQIKRLLKIYILSKPLARGYIPLSIDNADIYFGNDKDTKIYKLIHEEDTHVQEAKFLEGDFLRHLTPFQSGFESIVIDTTKPGFIFCQNFILDPNLNVIYEQDVLFNETKTYTSELPVKYEKLQGSVAYLSNSVVQKLWTLVCLCLTYA